MPTRLRIAFASCRPQAERVKQVAPRFGAIADVQVYECAEGEAEAVVPALLDASPHVVVADPKPTAYLAGRLRTAVVPFELTAESLAARIDEAGQGAGAIGILAPTGTVSSALARFLKRTAGTVHVLPWENHSHVRDLIARCRRMGIQTVIGGGYTVSLARQEGLRGLCLYDRPDEPDGAISQMIATAAAHGAPRLVRRPGNLAAFGLILEKICQGAIGPHDTLLCTDARGVVTAVFAHRCEGLAGPSPSPTPPTGVPLTEALAVPTCRLAERAGDGDRPLQVDLYPLVEAGGDGYVAVVRGEPRRDDAARRDWWRQRWRRQRWWRQ